MRISSVWSGTHGAIRAQSFAIPGPGEFFRFSARRAVQWRGAVETSKSCSATAFAHARSVSRPEYVNRCQCDQRARAASASRARRNWSERFRIVTEIRQQIRACWFQLTVTETAPTPLEREIRRKSVRHVTYRHPSSVTEDISPFVEVAADTLTCHSLGTLTHVVREMPNPFVTRLSVGRRFIVCHTRAFLRAWAPPFLAALHLFGFGQADSRDAASL